MGVLSTGFHVVALAASALVVAWASEDTALARDKNAPDIKEIAAKVEPSVVAVRAESALGSGFVVDRQGLIVTNYHVIEGAREAKVSFPFHKDKKSYPVEGFVAILVGKDLALIKIKAGDKKLVALKIAEKEATQGEWVASFSASLGLSSTDEVGKISAIRKAKELIEATKHGDQSIYEAIGYDRNITWLQHTAPMPRGGSGTPLVNARAEVVGITTWCLPTTGRTLNFALPSPYIRDFVAAAGKTVRPLSKLPPSRD